ncbi:hypothetical protein DUNSADRAFT_8969 [Dunaliella salina]|uniref:Uncharacterized protein n=1 Tax=Dunaliella salina TaxID=3046 RepID=A0ABQ7GIH4_DUNSA|nr:hypothetical protein DUNSADRAFT_8969 [Dunaliella salina]|eukprot:KAF5834383.1 hypothetical protein DUNSADRAFT_8969 [Dunaliella salina]
MQLLRMLQEGSNGGFVGGVHKLSEVEPGEHGRAILQQQQKQMQQQQEEQQPAQQQQSQEQHSPPPLHQLDHWPELGSQDAQPAAQQTSGPKVEGPPPDWQPVFATPPAPPRISLSRVRSRAVDVRCVLEAMVYRGRGAASHCGERYGLNHVFRDTLKMDTRLGVYQKLRLWVMWKELSHKCHESYGSTHHTQARLEKDLERIDAYEAWLVGHVLETLEDTEAFGTREAYAAATADRDIAIEEACGEILLVLDAAGGVALRSALQLQLVANQSLTLGRWERANSLLTESLHLLAHNDLINFQYTGCRELVRSRPHSRNLSRIHMATNAC